MPPVSDPPSVGTAERARALAAHDSLRKAIGAGATPATATLSLAELIVLGLIEQGVRTFVGVLGHGSTTLADVMATYETAGAVRFLAVRHETEAAHAATALRVATGQRAAVVTSIGPGALQAFAGSLTSALNHVGVWHIYGDATTEAEGPNMQDLPGSPQLGWQRLTSCIGASYSLHTPQAVTTALQRGAAVVDDPYRAGPFYLLLPLNVQPAMVADFNLLRLPAGGGSRLGPADADRIAEAARILAASERVVVKVGAGARALAATLERFLDLADGVAVLSPNSVGALPYDHPRNMLVGGSKGSISGNHAMENGETLVALGARAVCQSDCSRTGYPNVTAVVNVNADAATAAHYNRTTPLVGDLERTLEALSAELIHTASAGGPDRGGSSDTPSPWLAGCRAARAEWDRKLEAWTSPALLEDPRWDRGVLTQAAALRIIEDWAAARGVFRWFDAGDVQATAFQVSRDQRPDASFTDGGASYMGFGASALLATALSPASPYSLSVVGDGSFLMNPQALIDGVVHGARGAIVVLDNRRMGAISALQEAQYGRAYATFDDAEIDFVRLAGSVEGVVAVRGGGSAEALVAALEKVFAHGGVGLVHVPVYYGPHPRGSISAFGRWNVGSWVSETQALRHRLDL